ncbi:MAG: hypothetical protein AAF126_13180, partial [Chloroflexota bacterium]
VETAVDEPVDEINKVEETVADEMATDNDEELAVEEDVDSDDASVEMSVHEDDNSDSEAMMSQNDDHDSEENADTSDDDDYAVSDSDVEGSESVSLRERVMPIVQGIASVVGRVDWARLARGAKGRISEQMDARVPAKYHIAVYAVIALVLLGLPTGGVVWMVFSGNGTDANVATTETIPVSQTSEVSGIIAPLFTPGVQQWASDLERWTAGTDITPDYLAVVMQLSSCGNPNYADGGLFALADAPMSDNDAAAQAAIARLQTGLSLTDGDWQRALAYYVDGESVLTDDFTMWSFEARDMFMIGHSVYVQARNEYTSSQDLASWLQATGNARCLDAQQARGN